MTYDEAINWLFVQFPMYQKMGKMAYKADLNNTIKLATHLNNPERNFKSIHVGGTNGKGSTSHILASVLQEAGYKVGLYTSPHLKDFRERIKINGELASKDFVLDFVESNQDFFKANQLSFFEMTVGMAFEYFSKQKVDIAVIEVGLGGRLDSTNIIQPELSVITNIGLDHTQFLGTTLPEIAFEKAGIIKSNTPCIIGTSIPETKAIFQKVATERESPLFFAEEDSSCPYNTDLLGDYQKENCKTAYKALQLLIDMGWKISAKQLKKGFFNVIKNTGLQGRWQVLSQEPYIVCDTAHNYEGLVWTLKQVDKLPKQNLHIVVGVVNDKDLDRILPLFPKNALYYFTKPNNNRSLPEKILAEKANGYKLKGATYPTVKEALKQAKKQAHKDDVIYIGGSTFVVAEIL